MKRSFPTTYTSGLSLLLPTAFVICFIGHGEMPLFLHVKPEAARLFQKPIVFDIQYNSTMSAFYTCHKEVAAVNKVLKFFRASYPSSPIYMFNDGGLPFLKLLAKRYKAHYHYYDQRSVMEPSGNYWNATDSAFRYIKDLIMTAVESKSDWVILLEDDSIVLQPIDTSDLKYDQNGGSVDYTKNAETSNWWKIVQKYIGDHYPNSTLYYFFNGCGGTVLSGPFLRSLAKNMTRIYEQVDTYRDLIMNHKGASKSFPSDSAVTFITQVNGGTVGHYEHFGHVWPLKTWTSYWTNDLHILHGDKTSYARK